MWVHPPDRTKTTTTTKGTGPLTLAPVAAFGYLRPQDTVPQGGTTAWIVAMPTDDEVLWEEFVGTRNGDVLSRDQVLTNHDRNTDRVDFPPGVKEVFATAPGAYLGFTNLPNTWTLDQTFRGKLLLGPSDQTWLVANYNSSTGEHSAGLTLGGREHTRWRADGQTITQASEDPAYGPDFVLERVRAAGVIGGTQGPRLAFDQSDGASPSVVQRLACLASYWRNLSSGGNGALNAQVLVGGNLTTYVTLSGGNGTIVRNAPLLVGKTTAGDLQAQGTEAKITGEVLVTTNDTTPITANRKADDGDLIAFYRGVNKVGQVDVTSGAVAYGNFRGVHPSRLPDGEEVPDEIPPGTVMVSADGRYPSQPHLPLSRISTRREDPRAYGVFVDWKRPDYDKETGAEIWNGAESGDFTVGGVGMQTGIMCVGPVRGGDLLITSDVPGCAEAWRWSWRRFWRLAPNPAAVLGKVHDTDERTEKRLVCAAAYAG